MQELLSSTNCRFCIRNCFKNQLPANFLFCNWFSLEKFLQFLNVFIAVKGDAFPFAAVTSGSSGFLIVALQTFKNIVVNYKTYIRLVNSHTKSNGGNNHIGFFHQKFILMLGSCGRM